ncbi:MAG: hypothetical protein H7321_00885 [Bacteroidia bacterium]|nr:hypothetical protein [Bacteroidia bacterium]
MKILILSSILTVLVFGGCDKGDVYEPALVNKVLEGGTGGIYSLAVYSKLNATGVNSRIYLKYAADKMPVDSALYDEKDNAVPEPGFGPHVHFHALKTGTYYIYVKTGSAQGETVVNITAASKTSQDISVDLK